jgi:hypothetical protein
VDAVTRALRDLLIDARYEAMVLRGAHADSLNGERADLIERLCNQIEELVEDLAREAGR